MAHPMHGPLHWMDSMQLLTPSERAFAARIEAITLANPFSAERVELEAAALGDAYVPTGPVKTFEVGAGPNPNTPLLAERIAATLAALRDRAAEPGAPSLDATDREAAGHLAMFALYHAFMERLFALAEAADAGTVEVPWYSEFEAAAERELYVQGASLVAEVDPARLLALFFQMARAFLNVFAHYVGRTPAAARLRASMWESIFTHDLGRYRRALSRSASPLVDVPTLITGPSGTGKELVARAVGRSGYVVLDVGARGKARFVLEPERWFLPVHLASLSPALIESELFGHRRGAFTGALEDRASFLEACAPYGAVFLDELGEIDGALQVKLLRVLQTREFRRLGGSAPHRFEGRLVSATNRDLAAELESGRFREDLYFRLNADRIETPALAELLAGDPAELEHLASFAARRVLPGVAAADDAERAAFTAELCTWIEDELGLDHPWPGNFRELEQCARAFLVRGSYRPERRRPAGEGLEALLAGVRAGDLTADALLTAYCRHVHAQIGTYEGTARRLGLDRRTIKSRVTRDA